MSNSTRNSVVSAVQNLSITEFFRRYGLAFVMVASYFGSGSVFIASSAGVRYGYGLLWAVVGAVLLGFMAQDMSARLGIFGEPLMVFARRKLGKPLATAVAILLSVGCVAWCLELTAAVGKGVSVLLGGAVGWQPLALVTGGLAIVVGILGYGWVERVMTGMMLGLLVAYVAVAGAAGPSLTDMAAGFVPTIPAAGAVTLAAGILGTTALWPNFFLESNLVQQKGWTDESAVSSMRTDLSIGYAVGGLTTIAIVVVAAAVLRPAGVTELATFLTPGEALATVLGDWAMAAFIVGAVAAAFNSIVPIMWAPAYMIPHAYGMDVTADDRVFKLLYAGLVALGSLSPLVHIAFGLSVVDMIILFPAYNGVVGLPITAVLLLWAVNDSETMDGHANGWKLNVVNSLLVLLSIYLAISSAEGVFSAIFSGSF
ncbi:Nramp family divalent metal transporter [Halogranum rubrum]|uniref:Mn2+ and Fe2+ transporter-like protein n=1 Tax=Halogranum salarium B-1 TaxID=1210908 RepID=J3JI14_9EURY|nr:Nramp family divalent metal transporter [Halogranum salarium]EJN61456.1 Mn2+ and Fe2+ transporter-like protein [Halogranum salarium B-1]